MSADPQSTVNTVANFNEARAERERNSTLWTPKDALERLLKDINEGRRNPTLMYVCLSEETGRGTEMLYHYCAGGRNMQYAGLLHYHLYELSRDSGD